MEPTSPADGLDYTRIIRRIARLMLGLAILGSAIWWAAKGLPGLAGFLGGALISCLSFWLLHRLVRDIQAATEGHSVRGTSAFLHAFRTLILGGAAYVIVSTYGSCRPALVTGLLVAVTAATLEVLIELFYARA